MTVLLSLLGVLAIAAVCILAAVLSVAFKEKIDFLESKVNSLSEKDTYRPYDAGLQTDWRLKKRIYDLENESDDCKKDYADLETEFMDLRNAVSEMKEDYEKRFQNLSELTREYAEAFQNIDNTLAGIEADEINQENDRI